MEAVNDSEFLQQVALKLFSHFLQDKPYVHTILELVRHCIFETVLGEYIDGRYCYQQSNVTADPVAELRKLMTQKHFIDICEMKTGVYTFYMPVACGCFAAGYQMTDKFLHDLRERCLSLGVIFQAAVCVMR